MRGLGRNAVLPPAACPLPFTLCPYLPILIYKWSVPSQMCGASHGLVQALWAPNLEGYYPGASVYLLQVCSSFQALSYHNFT